MSKLNIKTLILLVFTCAFFFSACNSGGAPKKNNSSTAELQKLLEEYYQTMSTRNWKAYQAYFSSDASLTTIWKEQTDSIPKIKTSSITDFIAQTKDGPDSQPIFEEKMLSSEIEIKNNLAQAWVSYEAKFGTQDNLFEWKGIDLFSFIRYNNEWKIVAIVFEAE